MSAPEDISNISNIPDVPDVPDAPDVPLEDTVDDDEPALSARPRLSLEDQLALLGPLESLTNDHLRHCYRNGVLVTTVADALLRRIGMLDANLNAIAELSKDIESDARHLDDERYSHFAEVPADVPLYGMPVFLHFSIHAAEADLYPTLGNTAYAQGIPIDFQDSRIVARLRFKGALIMGYTNGSELCGFRAHGGDNGYSTLYGQTAGAYTFLQDPGGSCAGAAVAVDMGFCVAAIGMETLEGIVSAAGRNNVVGLKPSHDLVPRRNVVPLAPSQDTIGVLARSVSDATTVLAQIFGHVGEHHLDMLFVHYWLLTGDATGAMTYDFRAWQADVDGPLRIGVPAFAPGDVDDEVRDQFEALLGLLRASHTVVPCHFRGLDMFRGLTPAQRTEYVASEFGPAFEEYMKTQKSIRGTAQPDFPLTLSQLQCAMKHSGIDGYGDEGPDGVVAPTPDGEVPARDESDRANELPTRPWPLWRQLLAGPYVYHPYNFTAEAGRAHGMPRERWRGHNIRMVEQAADLQAREAHEARGTLDEAAQKRRAYFAGWGGIVGALEGHKCARPTDRALAAQGGGAAVNDHEPVSFLLCPSDFVAANYFANCGGFPQTTVPMGYFGKNARVVYNRTRRLVAQAPCVPVGVSLIGHVGNDWNVQRMACTIERLCDARRASEDRRHARNTVSEAMRHRRWAIPRHAEY